MRRDWIKSQSGRPLSLSNYVISSIGLCRISDDVLIGAWDFTSLQVDKCFFARKMNFL